MIDAQQNVWRLRRGDYKGPNTAPAPLLVTAWLQQRVPARTRYGRATA